MSEAFNNHKENRKRSDMSQWWEERSLAEKILAGIGFGILGFGLLALFGWIVMLLWNWLMPLIFGLKTLTYWQAWGLLLLCSILFKNPGGNSGRSDKKRKKQLRSYIRTEEPDELNSQKTA